MVQATILSALALPLTSFSQIPCPVALVSAKADHDSIQLEFRNKGRVPIEQLSLACSPPAHNALPNGACHVETGIFYPGTMSWIKLDYPAADRHPIEITVARLRLAGGTLWQPGTHACKPLKLPRNN
jgi:hypothetical protein